MIYLVSYLPTHPKYPFQEKFIFLNNDILMGFWDALGGSGALWDALGRSGPLNKLSKMNRYYI